MSAGLTLSQLIWVNRSKVRDAKKQTKKIME